MITRQAFELLEFKAAADKSGEFEALVAVFGTPDSGGDRLIKGAFAKTLKDRGLPPVFYSHQWWDGPIGATTAAEERDQGLWVKGNLFVDIADPYINRIHAGMLSNGPKEFSFTYRAREYKFVEEEGERFRDVYDVELFEVGPTLLGLHPDTELLSVASLFPGRNVVAGKDQGYLDAAHEALVAAGASCGHTKSETPPEPTGDTTDNIRRKRIAEVWTMNRYKEVS